MGNKEFGKGIKLRREQLGYTLDDLSAFSDVARSSISTVEQGKAYFSYENTVKVLNTLNCTFDDCMQNYSKHDLLVKEIKETLYSKYSEQQHKYFLLLLNSLINLR